MSTRAIPAPASAEQLAVGESDRYQLICEVGQGGMAAVHLALLTGDAGFRKLVALKQPKSSLSQDPEFMAMFLDEARLAARLNHPHVVQTYEVGRRGDQPFIAMEFLEGQALHRLQQVAPGGIPLGIHLRILVDMLSGLHHAHELCDFDGAHLGVVHRDVSPQNVLVSYDGQAKVVDFGIAKAVTHATHTEVGLVKGKLSYMSPEQTLGETLDRRADLFAAGVMLWEAGARARLWPGESARARLRLLSLAEIPLLREFHGDVPEGLERICRRALQYSPACRYQTAAELESAVEALLAEPALRATRRDVAAFMRAHFDAQRLRTRKLIEEQLGHLSLSQIGPLPAGNREPDTDVAPGTRRLPSVANGERVHGLPIDTPTTIAPASATLRGARQESRNVRRWLGLAVAGMGLAFVVNRVWLARPQTSAPVTTLSSALALPNVAVRAASQPELSEVHGALTAKPVAGGAHSTGLPAVRRANSRRLDAGAAAASGSTPVEAAPLSAEQIESGADLGHIRARERRPARPLDTADPWAR